MLESKEQHWISKALKGSGCNDPHANNIDTESELIYYVGDS